MTDRLPRKLAAIVYADVAGYSRLSGEDEDATHRALSEYLDFATATIQNHRGQVMHYAGDAVLARFDAVVDAMACAVAIQNELKIRNEALPQERKVEFRIGVNSGDVIEDRGDIYGDGVNVAARLEALAKPGGICVSESVRTAVGNKLSLGYESMGEQHVKNIKEPVRAYLVKAENELERGEAMSSDSMFELSEKPSVAVLPFTNMSDDAEQEYFADGITEDIITALSRSPWLFVIARNSSFAYRGSTPNVKQVAGDLGVRYVLEGSVRKAGNRVRVTGQLIDGISGSHIWAEKYDGELTDIFDLQDEITQNVVASLQTQIQLSAWEGISRAARPNVRTWDLLAQAWKPFYELTNDSLDRAEELCRKALEMDATSCEAHQLLAATLFHKVQASYADDWEATIDEAHELAKRAVALDESNEYAHWTLGLVELWRKNHELAKAEMKRAVELNPNCSLAYGSLGTVLSYMGESEESIRNNQIAIRTNPKDPSIFFRFSGIAMAHFVAGRYDQASQWAQKSIQRKPSWPVAHIVLVASLGHLARVPEAEEVAASFLQQFPTARIAMLNRLPFKSKEDSERLAGGLRIAGLRE